MYEKLGNLKEAKKYYLEAFSKNHYLPISQTHTLSLYEQLIWVLLRTNSSLKQTIHITKLGLSEYPTSWNLWVYLAVSEYKANNQQEALNAAYKAKELSTNDQTNYVYLQIKEKQPIKLAP
jgi:tetratricopeptide (TPR) repeat protein